MSDQNGSTKDKNNVVKLDRQRRAGAAKGNGRAGQKFGNGSADGYERAMRGQKGGKSLSSSNVRWFHYVQVIVLLLLVAWMMKSCGGL